MTSRAERHRAVAEQNLSAHQALARAHLEGREPAVRPEPTAAKPGVLYTPQTGESALDHTPISGCESSLRELRMYWKRISDFGIESFEIFPSEVGWAQVLYWGGTGENGQEYRAQEVDVVRTDEAFDITRFEFYSDAGQWIELVAYVNDKTPKELRSGRGYEDLIAGS